MSEMTSGLVELLPCPFCGGEKIFVGIIRDGSEVCCANFKCLATVTAHHPNGKSKAIAAWNARAPLPAPPAKDTIV